MPASPPTASTHPGAAWIVILAGVAAALHPTFPPPPDRERAVADYIAGTADRVALREHERLTGRRLWP